MKQDFTNAQNPKTVPQSDFTIFLDMDGVISDFDTHLDTHNKRDENGRTKWNELDYDWFSTMPVFEGARDFYYNLKDLAPVKFLTAPTLNPDCYSAKAAWISQKFIEKNGKYALKNLMITNSKDKCYIAAPKRILVDDRIKNIEEWEEAGGIGIHHTGDFAETLKKVKDVMSGIKPPQPEPEL